MTERAIAKEIVDAAFRRQTPLGPGLLESICLSKPSWRMNWAAGVSTW